MVDEEGWGVPCWAWPASQPASQPAQRAGVLAPNPHGDGVAHGRPIWEHFGSRRCADAPPPMCAPGQILQRSSMCDDSIY